MSLRMARSVGLRSAVFAATFGRGAPFRWGALMVPLDGDDIERIGGEVAMGIGRRAVARARPLDLRVSFGLTW